MRRRGVPVADLRRLLLGRIIPLGFALGAGMEGFMYMTGFWDVALRKEAERRAEKRELLLSMGGPSGSAAPGPRLESSPPSRTPGKQLP